MARGCMSGESRISLNSHSGVGFPTLMLGRTPHFLQLRKSEGKKDTGPWTQPNLSYFCWSCSDYNALSLLAFFPSKLAWFFFPFLYFFPSSVFPGSSDLHAVISHPAIESTQRMAHDQSLSALIYSSRKTLSALSVVALENSSAQSLFLTFFVFLCLPLVSFSEQGTTFWSRDGSALTRVSGARPLPYSHSDIKYDTMWQA